MPDITAKTTSHLAMQEAMHRKYAPSATRNLLGGASIALSVMAAGGSLAWFGILGRDPSAAVPFLVTALFVGITGGIFTRGSGAYQAALDAEWARFFSDWTLLTPAGERATCIGANLRGDNLDVRFDNGTTQKWSLELLQDGNGTYHSAGDASVDRPTPTYGLIKRMSRVRWKAPDGRVGTVRHARTMHEDDTRLTLAFDDGAVVEFEIGKLERVPN